MNTIISDNRWRCQHSTLSSSSSHFCAGQRLTPHNRTLEVRPGRIKLELKYDYDCERDDTNSLLGHGVLMFWLGRCNCK